MKQDMPNPSSTDPSFPQKTRFSRKILRRIFTTIAVFCLLMGAAKWTELDFLLGFQGGLPQEHPRGLTYEEVQETIEELTIQPVLPNWYPKGTVLEKMEVTDTIDRTNVNIAFTMDEEEFFLIVKVFHSVPIGNANYEKDPGPIEIYYVEKIPHHILPNMGRNAVVWKNGNTENMLHGQALKVEDIKITKKMIDSIYH